MEPIKKYSFMVSVLVGLSFCISVEAGITSRYVRRLNNDVDMPLDSDAFYVPPGYNAPQQVHITQGDYESAAVIVSWITPSEPGTSIVLYGPEHSKYKFAAYGIMTKYMYYNYTSGFIHHCTVKNLEFDTKYFYKIGIGNTTRKFHFTTSPAVGPDIPYTFGVIGDYTPQYLWLQTEFTKVNRTETPWLIVLMHAPLYNSYYAHYMEGETMRVQFESWFVKYKVDIVFAGHVHAYERSYRYSNVAYNITNGKCTPTFNPAAPVYLTVGDGGNLEGLAKNFTEPQPSYSAFREASFGHGILEIKNRTHAYFKWHRNEDSRAVVADSKWLYNRYWYHQKKSKSKP